MGGNLVVDFDMRSRLFIFLEYQLESDEVANDSAKLRSCCLETASSSSQVFFNALNPGKPPGSPPHS